LWDSKPSKAKGSKFCQLPREGDIVVGITRTSSYLSKARRTSLLDSSYSAGTVGSFTLTTKYNSPSTQSRRPDRKPKPSKAKEEKMDNKGNENRNVQMSSGDLSADGDCNNYAAYDLSKASMRKQMSSVIEVAEAAYRDHDPVRLLWNQTVVSWDSCMAITPGLITKESKLLKITPGEAKDRLQDFKEEVLYFNTVQRKVRKKLKYLKEKDKADKVKLQNMNNATLSSNTMKATTGGKAKEANLTLQEMAELNGHTIPAKQNDSTEEDKEESETSEESPDVMSEESLNVICSTPVVKTKLKQPQATPSKKAGIVSFKTPGQDTFISGLTAAKKKREDNGNNKSEDTNLLRMSSTEGKFCQQETAAQYQGRLRTASDEMCAPEAAEAVILCQDRLMVASESYLPGPGRAAPGEGQPGAVQDQGRMRTASEEVCMQEAAEAVVLCQAGLRMASEAYLLSPGRAVPGEGQPEAAIKGQPGPRMASERLCMLPPGHAGEGQPEADQYQGRQRTALEESCLPPGCAALGLVAWRRSRLPEKSRKMDDRNFFIHNMTQRPKKSSTTTSGRPRMGCACRRPQRSLYYARAG
jgi:hypothetical protein